MPPSEIPVGDPGGPVTLGEVYRHLLDFESRAMRQHQAMDDRLANALAQMVPREVWSLEHLELESRIRIVENERAMAKRETSNFERALMVGLISATTTGIIDLIIRLTTH